MKSRSQEPTDVVFTGPIEMFDDAVRREFCRPPDQTLLALSRDDRVGRLLVAEAWRSIRSRSSSDDLFAWSSKSRSTAALIPRPAAPFAKARVD